MVFNFVMSWASFTVGLLTSDSKAKKQRQEYIDYMIDINRSNLYNTSVSAFNKRMISDLFLLSLYYLIISVPFFLLFLFLTGDCFVNRK